VKVWRRRNAGAVRSAGSVAVEFELASEGTERDTLFTPPPSLQSHCASMRLSKRNECLPLRRGAIHGLVSSLGLRGNAVYRLGVSADLRGETVEKLACLGRKRLCCPSARSRRSSLAVKPPCRTVRICRPPCSFRHF
jgi:hypothetical protein